MIFFFAHEHDEINLSKLFFSWSRQLSIYFLVSNRELHNLLTWVKRDIDVSHDVRQMFVLPISI